MAEGNAWERQAGQQVQAASAVGSRWGVALIDLSPSYTLPVYQATLGLREDLTAGLTQLHRTGGCAACLTESLLSRHSRYFLHFSSQGGWMLRVPLASCMIHDAEEAPEVIPLTIPSRSDQLQHTIYQPTRGLPRWATSHRGNPSMADPSRRGKERAESATFGSPLNDVRKPRIPHEKVVENSFQRLVDGEGQHHWPTRAAAARRSVHRPGPRRSAIRHPRPHP